MSSTTSSSNVDAANTRGTKRKTADEPESQAASISGDTIKKRSKNSTHSSPGRPAKDASPTQSGTESQNSQEDVEEYPYIPDLQYYFDNGDVFITVGEEKNLFCVHRDKLTAEGGYLADVLAGDMVQLDHFLHDLPHLPLPLISIRQFRFLLAYLYRRIDLSKKLPDGTDWLYWEAALTLLKASTKLSLDGVRKEALAALEYLFPISGKPSHLKPTIAGLKNRREEELFHRTFPIQAVKAFSRYNAHAMLPMAYFYASQLSLDDIVNGVRNGTQLIKLDPAEMITVLKGREQLQYSRRQVLFLWLEEKVTDNEQFVYVSEDCHRGIMKSGYHCWEFLHRLFVHFQQTGYLDGKCNALQGLSPSGRQLVEEHLCIPCWEYTRKAMDDAIKENWGLLPGYFGLPSWEDLNRRHS